MDNASKVTIVNYVSVEYIITKINLREKWVSYLILTWEGSPWESRLCRGLNLLTFMLCCLK